MRAIAALAAAVLTMMIAEPLGAQPPRRLVVRLYNSSAMPTSEMGVAHHAADVILRDAGFDVRFRQCGLAVLPPEQRDRCDETLAPAEIVVRVIDAPRFHASLRADAFGVAYVVRHTDRGWLATVFADRINRAATRVGVDPGTLLGRVMAHEIGHLLLGVDYHSAAGVMLSAWPDAALRRTGDAWRFSKLESARMIHALPTESIPHQ